MTIITPPQPDPEWLKPFLSHCHRRRHPAKTEFIHPGDSADSIFYLISGQVTVLIEDEEGREIILTYLNKGEFVGEMGLFMPQPTRSVMVRTRSACELAEISYQKLERLFDSDLRPYTKDILYDFVADYSNIEGLAVEDAACSDDGDRLVERLSAIFPKEHIYRSRTTLVIGTHTGPGLLLVAVLGDK